MKETKKIALDLPVWLLYVVSVLHKNESSISILLFCNQVSH